MSIEEFLKVNGGIKFKDEEGFKNGLCFIKEKINKNSNINITILSGKTNDYESDLRFSFNDFRSKNQPSYGFDNSISKYITITNFLYDFKDIEYISIRYIGKYRDQEYYNVIILTAIRD